MDIPEKQSSAINSPCGTCDDAVIEQGSKGGSASAFVFRFAIAAVFAGQGMVFNLGYNTALASGEAPIHGSVTYWAIHGVLLGSAVAVVLILGLPLIRNLWDAIKGQRISVEALFVLSALGALTGSLVSSVRGDGSIYYEVVAVVVCVYALGKHIGVRQKGKVAHAIAAFSETFDAVVIEGSGSKREARRVADCVHGDVALVGPGDPIAVDGTIIEGTGYVRETALTGEPAPVRKAAGDAVYAGTWSIDGHLRISIATVRERRIDRILEVIQRARQLPSNLQDEADAIMRWFLPVVVGVAATTFVGWAVLSDRDAWQALFYSMSVLLVACPCALGLATPAAIWAGLFHLGQRGLLARNGHLLDLLATADTVIFDKTGTLSHFSMAADIRDLDCTQRELACIAALARQSPHPVSKALAEISDESPGVADFRLHPGRGLSGCVDGLNLVLGEAVLLKEFGISLPGVLPKVPGKPVQVAINGDYRGTLQLRESLRPDAVAVIHELKRAGIDCQILSGDPAPAFQSIAGVPVVGNCSPDQKADRIRSLTAQGLQVVFVGDGINDLPAFEAANAAIAIDLGTALASEYADGVLLGANLKPLPVAIRLCRRLRLRLHANLRFALAYNATGMALAAAGLLHPVVAALLMVGSSLIVSVSAMRGAG